MRRHASRRERLAALPPRWIAICAGPLALGLALCLSAPAQAAPPARRVTPVVEAVKAAQDAVVAIAVDQRVRARRGVGLREFFGGYDAPSRPQAGFRQLSQGSGVLLHPSGYVVTNHHVVAAGARIRVQLRDGREKVARVVGADPESDLAVLKIDDPKPFPWLPLGADGDTLLGETVIAIGNPFGLNHTVSTGIVSALHRDLDQPGQRTFYDFLQTDASINPGNSGGPLLNLDAEVIGINTAIYQHAQGIGFAIPAARVRRIVQDLVSHGRVREAWLGLVVGPRRGGPGVLVRKVLPGSPLAEQLRAGDVLLSLAEHPLRSPDEYRHRLRAVAIGAPLRLRAVGAKGETILELSAAEPPSALPALILRELGVEVEAVSLGAGRRRGQAISVARILQRSPAAKAGLRPGDLILRLGAIHVEDEPSLHEALRQADLSAPLPLVLYRDGVAYQLHLPLG